MSALKMTLLVLLTIRSLKEQGVEEGRLQRRWKKDIENIHIQFDIDF